MFCTTGCLILAAGSLVCARPAKNGDKGPAAAGSIPALGQPSGEDYADGEAGDGEDYYDNGGAGNDYAKDARDESLFDLGGNNQDYANDDGEDEAYYTENDVPVGKDYAYEDYSGGFAGGPPPFVGRGRQGKGDDYAAGLEDIESVKPLSSLQKLDSIQRVTDVQRLKQMTPLRSVQDIASMQEIKSVVPIPDEVARKFIRDKGLVNIAASGGGGLHAEASGRPPPAAPAAPAAAPITAGDEVFPAQSSPSGSGHIAKHDPSTSGGHSAKSLQRILDLFGIKSLDQITSVIPIESIHEVHSPIYKAPGLAADNAAVPSSAADEVGVSRGGGGGGGTIGSGVSSVSGGGGDVSGKSSGHRPSKDDPLAPIQKSLARENEASELLAAALKKHGERIKAIERVKKIHDIRRLEAIKRLEEVKQLLEVRGIEEVKSISELKQVIPLTAEQAAELKALARAHHQQK
jgi:hypothetical protein